MAVEEDLTSVAAIEHYINKQVLAKVYAEANGEEKEKIAKSEIVEKIEVRRNPQSHQIKALKALVKIYSDILNMTIDTGSPVSFLNWATTNKFWKDPRFQKLLLQRSLTCPHSLWITINVLF